MDNSKHPLHQVGSSPLEGIREGLSAPTAPQDDCPTALSLKPLLDIETCRGVIRASDGRTREFHRRGVVNLYVLLSSEPDFLVGATIADRVIGKGAAMLLIKGGVSEVYAGIISTPALETLRKEGIRVAFGKEVPYISNRAQTGVCPIERLTGPTDSPEEAYQQISQFMKKEK